MLQFEERIRELSVLGEAEAQLSSVGNEVLKQLDIYIEQCYESTTKLCSKQQKRLRSLISRLRNALHRQNLQKQDMQVADTTRHGLNFRGQSYFQLNFGMVEANRRQEQALSRVLSDPLSIKEEEPLSIKEEPLSIKEELAKTVCSQKLNTQAMQQKEEQGSQANQNNRSPATETKQQRRQLPNNITNFSQLPQNEQNQSTNSSQISPSDTSSHLNQASDNISTPSSDDQPYQTDNTILSEIQKWNASYLQAAEELTQQQAKQFVIKTRPNLKTCNMILYVNKFSNLKDWKGTKINEYYKALNRVYYLCEQCHLCFRGGSLVSYRKHLRRQHKIISNNFKSMELRKYYHELNEKVFKGDIILRKCNCSKYRFKSDQEYIRHMNEDHNGNIPLYSTHRIKDGVSLQINEDFNQMAAAEEILVPQIYFCGCCPQVNLNSCRDFIFHFESVHSSSNSVHPASSHFYTVNQSHGEVLNHQEH